MFPVFGHLKHFSIDSWRAQIPCCFRIPWKEDNSQNCEDDMGKQKFLHKAANN